METAVQDSHTIRGQLAHVARDIKVSHSVFALPFALLATFLAAGSRQEFPGLLSVTLIIACMILARTVAMTANRWADAALDAQNARTAGRAIPSGRVRASFMLSVAISCGVGFVAAASGFWLFDDNPWPVMLSPLVLAWLVLYSFTKRYTWLCHIFLGAALALSPLAASVAIQPAFMQQAEPYLLAVMVMFWVAGFDVIYALQDVASDRRTDIYSLPAKLGIQPALIIGALLHGLGITALIALLLVSPILAAGFGVGIGLVVAILVVEHSIVWRTGTRHVQLAFFTFNGIISLVLGGLGLIDVLRTV